MTDKTLLVFCAMMFGATEMLAKLSSGYFYKITIMFIPYVAIYLLGMNVNKFSRRSILIASIIFLWLYAVIAVILFVHTGSYVPTAKFKYPPRVYYVVYALGASGLLWCFRQQISRFLNAIRIKDFALFVGSHTFWIYLWHIPFVDYMVNKYDSPTTFVTVYFTAIAITYIQVTLVNKFCERINRPVLRKNLQMIFIG